MNALTRYETAIISESFNDQANEDGSRIFTANRAAVSLSMGRDETKPEPNRVRHGSLTFDPLSNYLRLTIGARHMHLVTIPDRPQTPLWDITPYRNARIARGEPV